jgi:hypothetical protein
MPALLILTVGTGTAGKHSDVATGLAHTIDLTAPRLKLAGGPKPS